MGQTAMAKVITHFFIFLPPPKEMLGVLFSPLNVTDLEKTVYAKMLFHKIVIYREGLCYKNTYV